VNLYPTYEEKETDVNIAGKLFQTTVMNEWDRAFIVSGDSDLVPAVKTVKATFPTKEIGVIFPIGRSSENLKKNCDFKRKMTEEQLASCQFPEIINLSDGRQLIKSPTWL